MKSPREQSWQRKPRKRVPFRHAPSAAEKKKYVPLVHQCLLVIMEKQPTDIMGQFLYIKFKVFPEFLHKIIFRGESTEYDFRTGVLKVQAIILLKWMYEKRYTETNPYVVKDLRKAWRKVNTESFVNNLEINEKSLEISVETEL